MQIKAVRIYGKEDLRTETFELPDIAEDEIRAKLITDSVCMSTYKLAQLGQEHSRASKDIHLVPPIIGHEFCGEIVEIGAKWQHKYKVGQRFLLQTAMLIDNSLLSPGFSFPYFGGNATYINIPDIVMEKDHLIPYNGESYYFGSLAEPMACIAAAYHCSYHIDEKDFSHKMGIKKGGKLALLASAGPMGLGAVEYAIKGPYKPSVLVVTDIDDSRLDRAKRVITIEKAKENGVELHYVNTKNSHDPVSELKEIAGGDFDDVFVMAPVESVIEQGEKLLGRDGCMNFFAGPTDKALSARINFYNVHYASTHIAGTTGSRLKDMQEVSDLMSKGILDPTPMVTHIGGLNAAADTVLNLPRIPGGKKLIYNQIDIPLTALDEFEEKGKTDPLFAKLAEITAKHGGLWSAEAESVLLKEAPALK